VPEEIQTMKKFSLPLTRMLHENISILMCFVYSRKPLKEVVQQRF